MHHNFKIYFFQISKYLGLFWLSRQICKKKLRILCYHGFSMSNEHHFVPGLFIEPKILDNRLRYLAEHKYSVITLQEAYELKEKRNFPDDAVVITIDDGFYSTYKEALPIFQKYNFPATLYLTSYYFDKNCPIFNLAIQYIFFQTIENDISLEVLAIPDILSQKSPDAVQKIISFGTKLETEAARIDIIRKLGALLGVDYNELNDSRILNLITLPEMKELMSGGIDIQLHTHRHRTPIERELVTYEIERNKKEINPHLPAPMLHFCYPSGNWSKDHGAILAEQGILTATTCEPKLVNYDTPNYRLDRILDSSRISQIEFEAEISGFNEILRFFKNRI